MKIVLKKWVWLPIIFILFGAGVTFAFHTQEPSNLGASNCKVVRDAGLTVALQAVENSKRPHEISKKIKELVCIDKVQRDDYYIEVTSIDSLENAAVIHYKLWNSSNDSIQGGKIFNHTIFYPTYTVGDGTFSEKTSSDGEVTYIVENQKEDIYESVLQELEHYLKNYPKENPTVSWFGIPLTFAADTSNLQGACSGGTDSTTINTDPLTGVGWDGQVNFANAAGDTFANFRNADGSGDNENGPDAITIIAGDDVSGWDSWTKAIGTWDTQFFGTSTIESGTASVFVLAVTDNYNQFIELDRVHVSSLTAASNDDYNLAGLTGTSMSTLRLDMSFATTSQFADFPLTTAGINNISATSSTAYMLRMSADFDNADPTAQVDTFARIDFETADGSNSMKLLLNYCDPAVATAPSIESVIWFQTFLEIKKVFAKE